MSIHSCWNGRTYVLFSSFNAAVAYADEYVQAFERATYPGGADYIRDVVTVTSGAPAQWVTPSHADEGGTLIDAQESPPYEAGDDSPEVAEAVAAFWAAREAAWNAT